MSLIRARGARGQCLLHFSYLLCYISGCLGHPRLDVMQSYGCIFLAFCFQSFPHSYEHVIRVIFEPVG